MSPKVSVIIVNYNAGEDLAQCVQTVGRTEVDLEILVVDNDSRDGSIQLLQEHYKEKWPLKILLNQKNSGFAVACNQGSKAAAGEYLFYLNPDCIIEPSTIPVLLQCLQNTARVGMVGGLILNDDGTEQRGCRRDVPTPWKSFVNTFGLKHLVRFNHRLFSDFRLDRTPMPDRAVEVDAISGACMMVSKEAFDDVGPLDEKYFLHCEDLDWCMRFRMNQWKIMFEPNARLFHHKGRCSASRPIFVEWSKHKGMVRYYRKFFTHQYPLVMMWLVWCGIWFRFGLLAVKHTLGKMFGAGQRCE
ncbi:MAG: glycosyltransferase family 2 protein [Desulfopila sp.]|nr:glycosyltransferase family 2 protein [Desulfopila sp.]